MFRLLKHLKKREWLCALCAVVFIVAQVWRDLKMPDYMNTITQIAQGGVNAATGAQYEMSDIWANGGYMLLVTKKFKKLQILTDNLNQVTRENLSGTITSVKGNCGC